MGFLHLLPALPWHYPGWIPFVLSAICWAFLVLLAVFVVTKDQEGILGSLLYATILRLLLLFWTPTTTMPSDPVAEWRHRTSHAEQILRNLKADREMLQKQLHEADERHRRILASEIDEIDSQIAGIERERERLEGVVVGMESRERRKERGKMVGDLISDERREEAIRGEVEVGEGGVRGSTFLAWTGENDPAVRMCMLKPLHAVSSDLSAHQEQ